MKQQRPDILLIGNFLFASGFTPQVCETLATKLAAAGHTVLTTSRKRSRVSRLLDMLISTWNWRQKFTLAYVEVFSGPAFLWAEAVGWLLRRLQKPYIATLHGGNLPGFARQNPHRVQRLLTGAAAVTAPSGYLRTGMQPFCREIVLVPNGIDLIIYPHRLRSTVTPRLVWLRAFDKTYNPELAVYVLALLSREFTGVHLDMVGPDKDGSLKKVQALAEQLGVTANIAWPGRIAKAEVPARLAGADIFINTTNVDNTPVSIIEAMACGLCVVSTNVGGIPYLLEDNVDALLVPPDDADAMTAAVRRILIEPGLAERLSRNARAKVEQFDWGVVLPQWERIFNDILLK